MNKWCIFLLVISLAFLPSCKSNPQNAKVKSEPFPFQWIVGTWVGNWETYTFSVRSDVNNEKSLYCVAVGSENERLWEHDIVVDKEHNELLIDIMGENKFVLSPSDKGISYKGFPLIKESSYSLPAEFNWLLGIWTDGEKYVSFDSNRVIQQADFFGEPTVKGSYVINDMQLIIRWSNKDDKNEWYRIIPDTKTLAYLQGGVLRKLENSDEQKVLINNNVEKIIYGGWIYRLPEDHHTYDFWQFDDDGTGRAYLVISGISSHINFNWYVAGNRVIVDSYGDKESLTYFSDSDHLVGNHVYERNGGRRKKVSDEKRSLKPNKFCSMLTRTLPLTPAPLNETNYKLLKQTLKEDDVVGMDAVEQELRFVGTTMLYGFLDFLKTKTQAKGASKIDNIKQTFTNIKIGVYYFLSEVTATEDPYKVDALIIVDSQGAIIGDVGANEFDYGRFYKSYTMRDSNNISWGPWDN